MRSIAERDVLFAVGAADIEPVRLLELAPIAVRRQTIKKYLIALGYPAAVPFKILRGKPHEHEQCAIVAQDLLHGAGNNRSVVEIVPQILHLPRVPEQAAQAAGQQVHGGFVTGKQEQDQIAYQFIRAHARIAVTGRNQLINNGILGISPPLGDEVSQVCGHLEGRVCGRANNVLTRRAQPLCDVVGPAMEIPQYGRWHADQQRDHRRRQGIGEGIDEIAVATVRHGG